MGNAEPTIVQIIPSLDTGGAELSTIEITEALVRAGARAIVLTEGGRLAERITAAGGELRRFPAASKNPLTILANARALERLIRAERVSLLHARSRAPAWSARIAARRAGIPFVTTYHGAYAEKGPLKRAYNSVMASADRVIANSEYTARLIAARYGTGRDRLHVIHRGVDLHRFDPSRVPPERVAGLLASWNIPAGQPVILQVARLTGWKGQRVLIQAAAKLLTEGRLGEAILVLAGDDQGRSNYRDELVRLAVDRGLAGRVHLVGHVDDVPAALALAHVAVVASTEPEAFGRTAAEAQAMGCPVIATDHGAPPETVIGTSVAGLAHATGWLVPPGDPDAMARALAEALSLDAGDRIALGRRARSNVAARFTVGAMQRATLAVYDELLGTSLAPALARSGDGPEKSPH